MKVNDGDGDNEISNGADQDEMIKYLAVDSEVFTKTLTVRDSGSWRHESSLKSGRLEEPEVEIDRADDEPPRRNRSPSRGPSRSHKDRCRRCSRSQHRETGRKVNAQPQLGTLALVQLACQLSSLFFWRHQAQHKN